MEVKPKLRHIDHLAAGGLITNYPGLCSGLAIGRNDLGAPLAAEKYPLLTTLFNSRVSGLYELVAAAYGFQAAPRYLSKCGLCLDIRRFLGLAKSLDSPELQPVAFYENL